jgi:hypothetical protein
MKLLQKFLLALVLLLSLSASAEEALNGQCTVNKEVVASHQGCCSHHSGVCGCSGSRLLCCDGTLSPSCQCEKDDDVDSRNYSLENVKSES